ncbi:MAG: hypothetical protein EHM23_27360 [Acidobacteria bacterium]|nr:MAG: hypothetical protein EHM23_27360 [Acidobacteriota bacterium]
MMNSVIPCRFAALVFLFLSLGFGIFQGAAAATLEPKLRQRLNAHGDEFNCLVKSDDGKRLIIGTEKGDLIVWDIVGKTVVRTLNQGAPIRCLVALDKVRVLAGGGKSTATGGSLRVWDISTGTFVDWEGDGLGSVLSVAFDPSSSVAVAGGLGKRVAAWDVRTGRRLSTHEIGSPVTSLAVLGRSALAATVNLEEQALSDSVLSVAIGDSSAPPKIALTANQVAALRSSPDRRHIIAESLQGKATLFRRSGDKVSDLPGSHGTWIDSESILMFEGESPAQRVSLTAGGRKIKLGKRVTSSAFRAAFTPTQLVATVASADRPQAYGVFRQNSALAVWDLGSGKGDLLIFKPASVFTFEVSGAVDQDPSIIVTAGDDGFIRIWSLPDYRLKREIKTNLAVPQGIAILSDRKTLVFSCSGKQAPSEIYTTDVEDGSVRRIRTVNQPFVRVVSAGTNVVFEEGQTLAVLDPSSEQVIRKFDFEEPIQRFAVSRNGEWLGVAEKTGLLHLFETDTGRKIAASKEPIKDIGPIAVADDGKAIYTTEFYALLKRWIAQEDKFRVMGDIRGQTASLRVSTDGERLILGGNHQDVTVYSIENGAKLAAFETSAADFFVTDVWLSQNRLIMSTDTGVLIDADLIPASETEEQ